MIKYTPLPELWTLFTNAVYTSQTDAEGFVTLSSLHSVLSFNDMELPVTYQEFWDAMQYFLNRMNAAILQRRKKNVGVSKNKG